MLKAGVIGLGHGSRVLIDAFRLNNIEVYGVASNRYSNAKKISKEQNIYRAYNRWKDLVSDVEINIVAIAVPPYLQIEIIRECLKKNKKIFCEKPLGINIKKINYLFSFLKKNQKYIFMDYIFSEHEGFKEFCKIIKKKKKGLKDSITVNFNTQTYVNKNKIINWKSDIEKGGGIINIFLSHIVDYLIWFFGPINKTSCQIIKKNKMEIIADCKIEFISNVKAHIIINTDSMKKFHLIQFNSKNYQITLKNAGSDYGKNFVINYKRIKKNNKFTLIKTPFKDLPTKFKGDSRILLTSRIIKKLKTGISKKYHLKNLERFQYNEYILNYIRKSVKENKTLRVL